MCGASPRTPAHVALTAVDLALQRGQGTRVPAALLLTPHVRCPVERARHRLVPQADAHLPVVSFNFPSAGGTERLSHGP